MTVGRKSSAPGMPGYQGVRFLSHWTRVADQVRRTAGPWWLELRASGPKLLPYQPGRVSRPRVVGGSGAPPDGAVSSLEAIEQDRPGRRRTVGGSGQQRRQPSRRSNTPAESRDGAPQLPLD